MTAETKAAVAVVAEPERLAQALRRLRPLVQCGIAVRAFTCAEAARRWEAEQAALRRAQSLWRAAQHK